MKRLDYLDALRGFAITGVLIAHAGTMAGLVGKPKTLTAGMGTGVLLFFVISACTIFMTLSSGMRREKAPLRNFYIKRCMRLFPVYWVGIVFYTLVYGLETRGWRPGPEIWHYPLHITLLNNWAPAAMSSVVPGGWSISCEMMFYLFVPICYFFARSWKTSLALLVGLMAAGLLANAALKAVADPFIVDLPPGEVRQYYFRSIFSQLGTFGFGIVLYFLVRDRPKFINMLSSNTVNFLTIIVASAVWIVAGFVSFTNIPRQFIYGFSYLLFALALSQIPWRIAVNELTKFVGRISYSAYISHFFVLQQIYAILTPISIGAIPKFIILVLISAPITALLAYLGFRYIEQPTTRLAKTWITRKENERVDDLVGEARISA